MTENAICNMRLVNTMSVLLPLGAVKYLTRQCSVPMRVPEFSRIQIHCIPIRELHLIILLRPLFKLLKNRCGVFCVRRDQVEIVGMTRLQGGAVKFRMYEY